MDIQFKDDGKKGQFFIETGGQIVAEMTFVWAGSRKIIIDHTVVDKSLQGKNVGMQLVHQAVLFAREKEIRIVPLCPFASAIFTKTPHFRDVLI